MSVKLTKGQKVSLRKEAPNLKRVLISLGWDPKRDFSSIFNFLLGSNIDIDASVICIDKNGRQESIICFYNQEYCSGAIKHYGDNITGEGDGADEQIEINLDKVPENITKLVIIVNIYEAYKRIQHFGKVKNCFVNVVDLDTGKELVKYDVDDNFEGMTGIFVANVYRYKGDWKFKAIGQGVKVEDIEKMADICNKYGMEDVD